MTFFRYATAVVIFLLSTCFLTTISHAQLSSTELFSLEGTWKINLGDESSWADPAYDDSSWRETTVPGGWPFMSVYEGVFWYRKHFALKNFERHHSESLLLGFIGDTDEAFLNGVLIGSTGNVRSPAWLEHIPRAYRIPSGTLKENNVIAVRVGKAFYKHYGIYAGTVAIVQPETARRIAANSYFFRSTVVLLTAFASFLIGLYHLFLFIFSVRRKEHLYFFLFCFLLSIFSACISFVPHEFLTWTHAIIKANTMGASGAMLFLLLFIHSYLGVSRKSVMLIASSLTAVLWFATLLSPTPRFTIWFYELWFPVVLLMIVYLAILLGIHVRKRRKKAIVVIFISSLLAFFTVLHDILVTLQVYDFYFLTSEGFLALTVGIAISLAFDYATALKTTDEKVRLLTNLNTTSADIDATLNIDKLVDFSFEILHKNVPQARGVILYHDPEEKKLGTDFSLVAGDEALANQINVDDLLENGHSSGTFVGQEPMRLHWSKLTVGEDLYGVLIVALPREEAPTSDATQFIRTVLPQIGTAMGRAIAYQHIQTIVAQQRDALISQEKLSAIGVLAYGIRHEINNPLQSMISNIGYVHKQYRATPETPELANTKMFKDRPRMLRLFEGIKDSGNRIRYILDALESFRDNTQNAVDLDIHRGIDDALAILKSKMQNQIEISKEYCDRGVLRIFKSVNNVTLNVLSNAIDAIEDEGRISIKTKRSANQFVIEVKDTGKGMDRDTLAHVFEPFFTTKEPGKGTGLGMSLAHQIVTEQLRGKIEYQSEPGKGTTCRVTLPLS